MRKALVVGINHYDNASCLNACVNDALEIGCLLDRNEDGSKNFDVEYLTADSPANAVTREQLKSRLEELFLNDTDISLFFFSGHGYIEHSGGYLITSECRTGDNGLLFDNLLKLIAESHAKNVIIILDCCYSGDFGNSSFVGDNAVLKEGTTILTASAKHQPSVEVDNHGVFSKLLIDALKGSAANLLGDISPGSVYAFIDLSLGAWSQRPIFKTHVQKFVSLRRVNPPILLNHLHQLTTLFPNPDYIYPLDPDYEPNTGSQDKEKMENFLVLQKYNRVNLLIPVDKEHMYYAAINSKFCKLTELGKFYWNLVNTNRI